MNRFIEEVILSYSEIVGICKDLGSRITKDYKGKTPILIGLLKGCVPFMAELIKHIDCDIELDFMDVTSYEGVHSTGAVRILKDTKSIVKDRDIILVDDIIDSGLTIQEVIFLLKDRGAKSIEIAALLNKPSGRTVRCREPKYLGATVGPKFVVGFGLDYNQLYRNLNYVGVLKRSVYEKEKPNAVTQNAVVQKEGKA